MQAGGFAVLPPTAPAIVGERTAGPGAKLPAGIGCRQNGNSHQVCHCEEAAGRRGNLGKALPFCTCRLKMAGTQSRPVAALPERLVRNNSTAEERWCTTVSPDVSLRGPEGVVAACGLLAMTNLGGKHRFIARLFVSPVRRRERHAAPLQWCTPFNDSRYELEVPSRDCHVASLLAMTNLWLSPFYR